jgi:RNA polymerase sigma-70 factor (sigma-E family)
MATTVDLGEMWGRYGTFGFPCGVLPMMRIADRAESKGNAYGGSTVTSSRLELLYRTHAPAAVRLAYFLTGDVEAANDIVQDAFVRIAGRFADLRHIDNFEAYLGRTVVNLARNYFRGLQRKKAAEYEEGKRLTANRGRIEPTLLGQSDALWRGLQQLPRRQREAIVLRYYLDLSEHQTADLLGCAVGTVKSAVSRGLSTLRSEFTEEA